MEDEYDEILAAQVAEARAARAEKQAATDRGYEKLSQLPKDERVLQGLRDQEIQEQVAAFEAAGVPPGKIAWDRDHAWITDPRFRL